MTYYYIYKTTNTLNGKIYIGKHQTENLDDGYLGSGNLLLLAIKKYGKQNFTKQILGLFDNESMMNVTEKQIVNAAFIARKDVYNICEGGQGGSSPFKNMSSLQRKMRSEKAAETTRNRNIWTEEKRKLHRKRSLNWQNDLLKKQLAYSKSSASKKGKSKETCESIRKQIESRAKNTKIYKDNLRQIINKLLSSGLSVKLVAQQANVSESTVYRIRNNSY